MTDIDTGKGIDIIFERGHLLEEVTPDGIANSRYNCNGQLIEAENTHCKPRCKYGAVGSCIAKTLTGGEVLNFV
ncbi:hypothetical protein FIU95_16100 [Microbulbifer sp. THAF38]|nr:hypothetical protein FIU95_16100 [Microbulbifer sp. THAF38]